MARQVLPIAFLALNVLSAMAEPTNHTGDSSPNNDGCNNRPSVAGAPEAHTESHPVQCPEQLPLSCKDVKRKDQTYLVVYLYNGMEVLCETQTGAGGWMVIQRRTSGDINFYREWDEYKYGFGDYSTDFWFGLERLYQLTYKGRYELRIDMGYQNSSYYAKYSHFRVMGSTEKYKLEVGGFSGNAGDSLTRHNKMFFSTYDRDNDKHVNNCASVYKGAWWYKNCHHSNLNGKWGSRRFGEGVNWFALTTQTDSLSYVEMKIRPY